MGPLFQHSLTKLGLKCERPHCGGSNGRHLSRPRWFHFRHRLLIDNARCVAERWWWKKKVWKKMYRRIRFFVITSPTNWKQKLNNVGWIKDVFYFIFAFSPFSFWAGSYWLYVSLIKSICEQEVVSFYINHRIEFLPSVNWL